MHIALIAVDVRSTHNVGAFLRTCDGLGIDRVYLTGITPYPSGQSDDARLPHIVTKVQKDIHKTALGAEQTVAWEYHPDALSLIHELRDQGWHIAALEQDTRSVPLTTYAAETPVALVVGPEVEGLPQTILSACDSIVEIPMSGQKESFNVSVAAAIALYHLRYHNKIDR